MEKYFDFFFQVLKILSGNTFQQCAVLGFPSGLKGAFVSATESPHLSKPKSFYQAGSYSAARKSEPPHQACDILV